MAKEILRKKLMDRMMAGLAGSLLVRSSSEMEEELLLLPDQELIQRATDKSVAVPTAESGVFTEEQRQSLVASIVFATIFRP